MAQNGGMPCLNGTTGEEVCNRQGCPIDCLWLTWSSWSGCSTTCGGGVRTRTRDMAIQAEHGGVACVGAAKETPKCNLDACPVDCVWEPWSVWRACTASCGGGTRTRLRAKVEKALHGGKECSGSDSQVLDCGQNRCPVDCEWHSWSSWSTCTNSCGGGTRERFRSKKQESANGGMRCIGVPDDVQYCNTNFPCPVDCEFRPWSPWSPCTKSCGVGRRTRRRHIDVDGINGGKHCAGYTEENDACNLQSCPVNCLWNAWTRWSECDKSCGSGTTHRYRSKKLEPQNGGVPCNGEREEKHACSTLSCPVDCAWYEWEPWHSCTKTCGGGTRKRLRNTRVAAANGGLKCVGEHKDEHKCGVAPCPIDCKWDEWGEWGKCSKSCGGGKRTRTRKEIPGKHGGLACRGVFESVQWCAVNHCADSFNGVKDEAPAEVRALIAENPGEDGGAGAGASSSSSGSSSMFFMLIGGIVLLAGGMFFMMGGQEAEKHESKGEEAGEEAGQEEEEYEDEEEEE